MRIDENEVVSVENQITVGCPICNLNNANCDVGHAISIDRMGDENLVTSDVYNAREETAEVFHGGWNVGKMEKVDRYGSGNVWKGWRRKSSRLRGRMPGRDNLPINTGGD